MSNSEKSAESRVAKSLLDLARHSEKTHIPNYKEGTKLLISEAIHYLKETLESEDSFDIAPEIRTAIQLDLINKNKVLIELGKVFLLLGRVLNDHIIIPQWGMVKVKSGKAVYDELIRTILKTLGSDISVGIITKNITNAYCSRESGFTMDPQIAILKEVAIKLQKHEVGGKGSERGSNLQATQELYTYLKQVIALVDVKEGQEFSKLLELNGDISILMDLHTKLDIESHFTMYNGITQKMLQSGMAVIDDLYKIPIGKSIITRAETVIREIAQETWDEEYNRISMGSREIVTVYIMDVLIEAINKGDMVTLAALQLIHNPETLLALDREKRFLHELITVKAKASNWTLLVTRIGFFNEMMRLISPNHRELNLFTFNTKPYTVKNLDAKSVMVIAKTIVANLRIKDNTPEDYRRSLLRISNYINPKIKEMVFNLVRLGIQESQLNITNQNHAEDIVFSDTTEKEQALQAALNDSTPNITTDQRIVTLYTLFNKGMHRTPNVEVPYLGCLIMLNYIEKHGTKNLWDKFRVIIVKDKNTKFMLKKLKYEDGVKIYAGSYLELVDGVHKQVPFAILFQPGSNYNKEQMGKISNYSTQTFVPTVDYLMLLLQILRRELPVYRPGWKVDRTLIYGSTPENAKLVPAIYLDGTRTKDGSIIIAKQLQNYRKTYDQLFTHYIKKSGKASSKYPVGIKCKYYDSPILNPDVDGGGYLVIDHKELFDHISWDREITTAKIIGGITEDKPNGETRVISILKANLDILNFQEALDLKLLDESDRAYLKSGGCYVIANSNAVKRIVNVETNVDSKFQDGFIAITKYMNSVSYETSASFSGVMNSFTPKMLQYIGPNIVLSSNGTPKITQGTLSIQYITASDLIGPPNKDLIITLHAEYLRYKLSPYTNERINLCSPYRFPFDGNMAICKIVIDTMQKAPIKITAYAMKIIGGDTDGDGASMNGLPASYNTYTEEEVRLELGIFDPRIITE